MCLGVDVDKRYAQVVVMDVAGNIVEETVLDELAALNVNQTPPVELMAKVQAWQGQLDEE